MSETGTPSRILRIGGIPNDRQKRFFASRARFTAYGGARGGGKSWALRRKLCALCLNYPGIRCLLVRRSYAELKSNHVRPILKEYAGLVTYRDGEKCLFFPNGSTIALGYCASNRDVLRYQGQEYDVIAIDEATDSYIFSMYREAGHTIDCPSTTGPDIINAIIDARTKLLISGVSDPNDIVIEITPEIASLIMKAKIEINSDNTAVLEKGCIGNIFGSPIFVSSNVQKEEMPDSVTHHCLVRTKRAVAFAEQLSEIEAYRPELRFADAMKGLHLFGAKVIYPKEIASVNVVFPVEEVDLG